MWQLAIGWICGMLITSFVYELKAKRLRADYAAAIARKNALEAQIARAIADVKAFRKKA